MATKEMNLQRKTDSARWVDWNELDEFGQIVARFERGELTADEFKGIRLKQGVYGQRQPGYQMVRVKIPGGRLTADQCEVLGRLADSFADGVAHVTTRQDIQYHFVRLQDVTALLGELAAAGLTTREACGNSVRNVTACPLAGVCRQEEFDVHPHAAATARALLRNPRTQALPRKFKIAFSGCATDCALAGINDIGLVARTRKQAGQVRHGFRLLAGGGLGSWPRPAMELAGFVPVEELQAWVDSILEVFDRFGNRRNRNRARLKFVLAEKGFDWFRDQVIERVRERGVEVPNPAAEVESGPSSDATAEVARASTSPLVRISPNGGGSPELSRWKQTNLWPLHRDDQVAVWVTLPGGALRSRQFSALANLIRRYGDGSLRTTPTQNVVLPNIARGQLDQVYAELSSADLALPGVMEIADVTSCPGAETCNLGLTRSRSLMEELNQRLRAEEDGATRQVSVKISGCPNSCGHHHIADIGLHGLSRKMDGQQAPFYQLLLGGSVDPDTSRFGQRVAALPARRVPEAVERVLNFFRAQRLPDESFRAFVRRKDPAEFKKLLEGIGPAESENSDLFRDWGEEGTYQLQVGVGECAS